MFSYSFKGKGNNKRKILHGRKGQIENYIVVVLFLFGFGIISMIAAVLHNGLTDAFTDAGIYVGQIAVTGNQFYNAILMHDVIVVIFMAVLIIGVGLTSFRLNTAPAFFILSIIAAAFMGLVSYFFNYLFSQIVSNSVFDTVRALFPNTILICTNLHWIALAALVIGSVTLYAKRPSVQGEGIVR